MPRTAFGAKCIVPKPRKPQLILHGMRALFWRSNLGEALDKQPVAQSKECHALIGIVRWLLLLQHPLILLFVPLHLFVTLFVICYFCHHFHLHHFQMHPIFCCLRYEPGDEVQVTVLDEQHPWGQDQKLGSVILKNFEPQGFEGWRPLYHGAWLKVAIFMSPVDF